MEWYEPEVADLVVRLAERPVQEPAVFYGSSSIRMWDTLAADLADERAVNAGFGGSTLAACDYFFARIVPPLRPASLVLYAGDNDLGDGRSPEAVLASFRSLVDKLDACCGPIPFGFISIKPSPARAAIISRIRRANKLVGAEIARRPHGYLIPVFDAMLAGGKPRPELFLDDGLHLSPEGYALWTQLLEPYRPCIFPEEP